MKRFLLLILAGLLLAGVACETIVPSARPAPTPIPTLEPTASPISTFASTLTRPDALSIVRAAEENLRAVSSYHISIVAESRSSAPLAEAYIVPPDRGRFLMDIPVGLADSIRAESIIIGTSQYVLYEGFQGWLDAGAADLSRSDLHSFPYDLGALREGIDWSEGSIREVVFDGMDAYHITGTGTAEMREVVGFRPGTGGAEIEVWISLNDLFPLRIEASVEDPWSVLAFTYSDFGADVVISVPENAIDIAYLERLLPGDLSPEELGQVVRILPVPGQQCIEAEIGRDAYRAVIGGHSEAADEVSDAYITCYDEVFPGTP